MLLQAHLPEVQSSGMDHTTVPRNQPILVQGSSTPTLQRLSLLQDQLQTGTLAKISMHVCKDTMLI